MIFGYVVRLFQRVRVYTKLPAIMNIIIIRNNGADAKSISLSTVILVLIIIFFAAAWTSNYYTSLTKNRVTSEDENSKLALQVIHREQKKIKDLQATIDFQIDTFVVKLAQIQSRLIQLDHVGEKLVEVSKLNKKEFNFDQIVSIGGPELIVDKDSQNIEHRLSEIQAELKIKSMQLFALEALYDDRLYLDSVTPKGKPAEKGWISSYFGKRKDPFTGKNSHHTGVDLAGKENSNIIATATGMVTWAKKRSGYGNLVEITHGNGLVTRYGHCKKILVKEGQKINQGDKIATIGSTGRSTGPHVHYEVLRNGQKINPISYVKKKRLDNKLNNPTVTL